MRQVSCQDQTITYRRNDYGNWAVYDDTGEKVMTVGSDASPIIVEQIIRKEYDDDY